MITRKTRTLFASLAFVATLVSGLAGMQSRASADVWSCEYRAENLCFWDAATNRCGYVSGWNGIWGNLPGGWNDRADEFINDGTTHAACIYQHNHRQGTAVRIPVGGDYYWSNTVSSNSWTTASSCPR